MTSAVLPGPLPDAVARSYPFGYAVVDVETSGLHAPFDRVLQIAVYLIRADGALEMTWSTLLNPGCDPGPMDIHGLTRERLAGAPVFADVSAHVAGLLAGRILVAHNARFDWDFLASEAHRAHVVLAVHDRLCTIAMTRRLDVPTSNLTLGAVAAYWRVPQQRAHDAVDDARVVVEILRHSLVLAQRLGIPLPLTPCSSPRRTPAPAAAPRPPCAWRDPGRWQAGLPLRQGMKIVFTGDTSTPREVLTMRCAVAGLDAMNSVSSRTSALICNSPTTDTRKAQLARRHGTPVLTEAEFESLLGDVWAGEPKQHEQTASIGSVARPAPPTPAASGPLVGYRVLVVGGTHDEASALRTRIAELGGQGAGKLTASVTHVVALSGHDSDARWSKIMRIGLPTLDANTLSPGAPLASPSIQCAPIAPDASADYPDPIVLPRGGVTDLPATIQTWSLSISWTDQHDTCEVDVVAFAVDADDQVGTDGDFCFYNQPEHPTGAVVLDLDTPTEAVATLRPDALPDGRRRIVVAAALDGDATFGHVGPIELVVRTEDGQAVVRATLDAATEERSLLLANIYQRNGAWRFRAVGQGYVGNLAALAVVHGVDIDEA
jgi:DNA polymerase III subunit epsilon